jgi:hypothetical protein
MDPGASSPWGGFSLSDAGLRSPGQAERLTGRDTELGLIRSFLAAAATRGGALLLAGEPGAGKTALLEAAASAAAAGTRVVRAAGAEFEADVSFSGLNQLLLPLFGELSRLDGPLREPLSVALGLGEGPAPDRRVVAEAMLALLELPAAFSDSQRVAAQALPSLLPMSRRLQALFATRVSVLPVATRRTLLIAALNGTGAWP